MSNGIEALKSMDRDYFSYFKDSGEKLLKNEEILFLGNKVKEKKGLLGLFK